MVFTSASQMRLWVMLEANPQVSCFCERPLPAGATDQAFDFWVIRNGKVFWLAIGDKPPVTDASQSKSEAVLSKPDPQSGVEEVHWVSPTEIYSHRIWIQNWLSLLPYLCTTSALSLNALRQSVLKFYQHAATLEDAELALARNDPVLVRSAVIAELHAGTLVSDELTHRPWDRSIVISQLLSRSHATQ